MLCIVVYLSPGSTNMADVAPVTHNIIFLKMDDSLLQKTLKNKQKCVNI